MFPTVVILAAIVPAIAQMGGGSGGELQQKLAAVKQSVAENQQELHHYQWIGVTRDGGLLGDPAVGLSRLGKQSLTSRRYWRSRQVPCSCEISRHNHEMRYFCGFRGRSFDST